MVLSEDLNQTESQNFLVFLMVSFQVQISRSMITLRRDKYSFWTIKIASGMGGLLRMWSKLWMHSKLKIYKVNIRMASQGHSVWKFKIFGRIYSTTWCSYSGWHLQWWTSGYGLHSRRSIYVWLPSCISRSRRIC